MELNWWLIGIVLFFVVILIVYLIWKNLKDEKDIEKTLINEEMKPKEHDLYDEEL